MQNKYDAQIKDAIEYSAKYEPQKNKKYKWVYEHAEKQYERADYTFRVLDSKADSMIKYLSPTSGILGTALTLIMSYKICTWISLIGIVGILFTVIAIVLAAYSLKPRNHVLLPSIKNAIESADYYENENLASIAFATGIGIAIEQNMSGNERKAKFIDWSYRFFVFAIITLFFLMPLVLVAKQFFE